jgi:hypothetical protein
MIRIRCLVNGSSKTRLFGFSYVFGVMQDSLIRVDLINSFKKEKILKLGLSETSIFESFAANASTYSYPIIQKAPPTSEGLLLTHRAGGRVGQEKERLMVLL